MPQLTEQDKQFLRVHSIELDTSPEFHHNIILRDINNFRIDSMKVQPDDGYNTWFKIKSMWEQVKFKENQ